MNWTLENLIENAMIQSTHFLSLNHPLKKQYRISYFRFLTLRIVISHNKMKIKMLSIWNKNLFWSFQTSNTNSREQHQIFEVAATKIKSPDNDLRSKKINDYH